MYIIHIHGHLHRASLFVPCWLSLKQVVDVSMMIPLWHYCSSRYVHLGSCAPSSQQAEEQGEEEQTLLLVGEWSFPLQMLDHLPIIIIALLQSLTVKGSAK